MAITQNPIIGRAKGTFGTGVLSTNFGKNILRSKPVAVRDAKTPAQIDARSKFTIANLFIRGCYPWVKSTFPSGICKMNPAAFVLPSVLDAVTEPGQGGRVAAELAWNHFNPTVSSGLQFDNNTSNQIEITFNPSQLWHDVQIGDQVNIMIHNEDRQESALAEFTLSSLTTFNEIIPFPGHYDGEVVFVYASIKRISATAPGAGIIQSVY